MARRSVTPLLLASLLLTSSVQAHELPNDVTVQAFLKPEGHHLRVLVRVPLKAMRDFEFPSTPQGYLDLDRVKPILRDAATVWIAGNLRVEENSTPLPAPALTAVHLALESDKSFGAFDQALAHLTAPPLDPATQIVWNQTLLDVLLDYPIASEQSRFSIHSTLARLGSRVLTVLRFVLPSGAVRAFEFTGDPGPIPLDPGWLQAAARFVQLGFLHILDGTDHLLFLFCLVIPVRRLRALIPVITAFTAAHSITLIASAYDWAPSALWFPPLIETLIATSIVFMAFENVVEAQEPPHAAPEIGGTSRSAVSGGVNLRGSSKAQEPPDAAPEIGGTSRSAVFGGVNLRGSSKALGAGKRRLPARWIVAFAFGLIHGFGFSFALRETLQFAGAHLLTSLLSFNLGVELGQLLVLVALIPLLELFFRFAVAEKTGAILLSAVIAHTGLHWMAERAATLSKFEFAWPVWNAVFFLALLRWAMLLTALAGALWLVRHRTRKP